MQNFPQPVKLGDSATRWRLSDVLAYEAKRTGAAPPSIDPAHEQFLSVRAVAARLGVAPSTVWRWTSESREQREAA